MSKEVKEINTNEKKEHGANRCPGCGASDVTFNIKKQKLICNYCFLEFDAEDVEGIEKDSKKLKGENRASGTKDIDENANDIITLSCSGCGAEVVINTKEATNARCHWCRSILSINSQIENGAVPDVVLPFKLTKEEAKAKIEQFVKDRQSFADNTFKKEFTTNNIMGVYFPYMLVDANCHGKFSGIAGHVERSYKKSKGKNSKGEEEFETVYDIEMYDIEREFDIAIDDLSIESSIDKLDKKNKSKTTNVINSIMPFDTENCVKYKANYLAGYTSEKRDINISNIEKKVDEEIKDIARSSLNNDLKKYNAGVRWEKQELKENGKQWVSAYLPVWLYSYQDPGKVIHYVAVNARTGEVMGSVPMNKGKLVLISILLFLALFILPLILGGSSGWLLFSSILGLALGVGFYASKSSKYRNKGARHSYEKETKNELNISSRKDKYIETDTECTSSTISGVNNYSISGEYTEVDK